MNGEITCSQPCVVPASSCPQSASPVHDDEMTKQEGRTTSQGCQRNDVHKPGEGRTANGIGPAAKGRSSSHAARQLSSRRSDECTSPGQLQCHLQPAAGRPTQHGAAPLHSSNRTAAAPRRKRQKPAAPKTARGKNGQNHKVTDFFPIRRSSRKSKTELKCEQKHLIDHLIANGIEEGMQVRHMEGKGRAVFTSRRFRKGEFVVEYHGDLLETAEAKKREAEYAQNPETGCYMYYFQYLCKAYCVDATKETGRLGRLINHSKSGNLQTKLHDVGGAPHLILVASRDIDEGEELLYDYGDRSKASIAAHPWLKH
ncbi:N-lysine methyltransferase KMT5A-A isoform X2 [Syngnathoides biaculeatus]|uniref:N-lysine methyltransferase KMT5A-A isoform X2 n=1 Tax=Syngnathoides biaculeatus TaxID=300417 RepID=UPI002ADD46B2|nr:N-lysine methyltransferase KMT5A-A isoform X2 [Syngnathoides biaculeatus]